MSINQRIKMVVELERTQKDFAEKTNLKPSSVSMMINSNAAVKSDTLLAIIEAYPEINPTWLLTGRGDMYLTKEEQEAYSQAAEPMGLYGGDKMTDMVIDLLEKRVAELEREIKRSDPDLAREIGIE